MNSVRNAIAAPLLALFALWLRLAWIYPDLPERMPLHFGAGGTADRWAGPGELVRFYALFPALVVALLLGSGLIVSRLPPRFVNLPNREFWLAPERLAGTRARLFGHLALIATLNVALCAALLEMSVALARAGENRLPALFFWALGLYFAGMIGVIVSLGRGFGATAVARRRATEPPRSGRG